METIKKKRYWLRGGIIGVAFAIFLQIIPGLISNYFPYGFPFGPHDLAFKIDSFSQFLSAPLFNLFASLFGPMIAPGNEERMFGVVIIFLALSSLISFFAYGVFIGLIFGKIKKHE